MGVDREKARAQRLVNRFANRFSQAHLDFACHSAISIILTPDLLYRLWLNFQTDIDGQQLHVPWYAVSDLLLSHLCEEVGFESYEMNAPIREYLLEMLAADQRFGQGRIHKLAEFLQAYALYQLRTNPDHRDFSQVLQWTSLAYLKPKVIAQHLATLLRNHVVERNISSDSQTDIDILRVTSFIKSLSRPLAGYESLVHYSNGLVDLIYERNEVAKASFIQAAGEKDFVDVAGVRLPNWKQVEELQQENISTDIYLAHYSSQDEKLARQLHSDLLLAELAILWSRDIPFERAGTLGIAREVLDVAETAIIIPGLPPYDGSTMAEWQYAVEHTEMIITLLTADMQYPPAILSETTIVGFQDSRPYETAFDELKSLLVAQRSFNFSVESTVIQAHDRAIHSIVVSTDGNYAITADVDGSLKVWDLQSGLLFQTLEGLSSPINNMWFAANEKYLIVYRSDVLETWVWQQGFLQTRVNIKLSDHVLKRDSEVVFTHLGQFACFSWYDYASHEEKIQITEIFGKDEFDLYGHEDTIWQIIPLADSQRILSISRDSTLRVWDIEKSEQTLLLDGHKRAVTAAAVTSNNQIVVTASEDHTLKLWDLNSGICLITLPGHARRVTQLKIMPDDRLAYSISSDDSLKLWDLADRCEIAQLDGFDIVQAVGILTPAHNYLLCTISPHQVNIWDVEREDIITGFTGEVTCCMAVPGRSAGIVGYTNGYLHIFQINETQKTW